MKKNWGIFTFLTLLLTTLVSAGPVEGARQLLEGTRDIIVILIQFVSDLIFDINTFDEFLLAKILLFIIIFIVVNMVLQKNFLFSSDKRLNTIIALAISILSIRFIPNNDFIQAMILPYTTLGIAITTILPLVVFFFFLHQSNIGQFGRRAGWLIFGSIFIGLWSMRGPELGYANNIYWIAAIFVVISLIFDKSIHSYFGLSSWRKVREEARSDRRVLAEKKLFELGEDYSKGHYDGHKAEYEKKRRHWERVLRDSIK